VNITSEIINNLNHVNISKVLDSHNISTQNIHVAMDLLALDLNITNIGFQGCGTAMDPENILQIQDDMATFYFHDWNFGIMVDYEYISNPPILADIGTFTFNIENLTYRMNGTTTYDELGQYL
jgi:hypothetical protein